MAAVKDNYPEVHYVYRCLEQLHQSYEKDLTLDELAAYFWATYPDAKREAYEEVFKQAQEASIDPEVGAGILKQIKSRLGALKLSEIAYAHSQGRSSIEKVLEAVNALGEVEDVSEGPEGLDLDLDRLLDSAARTPGLRWRLNFLNKSLGSLRDGDFGFLMKRPETGGTAFLASEVSYMLDQTDRPIIWLNNEEQDNKVAIRVYQAYFGVTLTELMGNSAYFNAEWKRRVGDKFKFYGIEYSNRKAMETLIKKLKPALTVYDQIDKLQGFEADREDLLLGAKYQFAREMCKVSGAAIGVTQADGTAEGVKYLTMNHTANSKTSKAAEGDFIFGIGKTHNEGDEDIRYFNICKNKLIGDTDSIPELRHGRQAVLIKPSIMRYEDIISYD